MLASNDIIVRLSEVGPQTRDELYDHCKTLLAPELAERRGRNRTKVPDRYSIEYLRDLGINDYFRGALHQVLKTGKVVLEKGEDEVERYRATVRPDADRPSDVSVKDNSHILLRKAALRSKAKAALVEPLKAELSALAAEYQSPLMAAAAEIQRQALCARDLGGPENFFKVEGMVEAIMVLLNAIAAGGK